MKRRLFEIISIILITIILILDFIPNLFFDFNGWLYWLMLIILCVFVTISSSSSSHNELCQIIFSGYLIILLVLLTIIFGESKNGLSTSQGGFWIILALFIIQIYSYYKKKNNRWQIVWKMRLIGFKNLSIRVMGYIYILNTYYSWKSLPSINLSKGINLNWSNF